MSSAARLSAREQVRRLGELIEQAGLGGGRPAAAATVSTGCPPLDRLLPEGGFRRGALVEWLSEPPGAGAGGLAIVAAREASRDGGAVVVIDRGRTFYPPAAAAWGIDLAGMIVVHPASEADELWALDQALRCEHVAAVLAWPRRLEGRAFRRLQLAAESSGAMGLLVRPLAAEREPSWADGRLVVSPRPSVGEGVGSLLRLEASFSPNGFQSQKTPDPGPSLNGWRINLRLLRWRGGLNAAGQEIDVEIDELTGDIHEAPPGDLAAELAAAAARQQQA